ncbi:MAG: hypothetical protein ACRDE2_01450 [Chitinophagaceae bacterium]
MEDNFKDYFTESKNVISNYLEARWKFTRLQVAGKLAHALGVFLAIIIAAMIGFFVVMFLGLLLAFWISDLSGSHTLGFGISALIFIILFIFVLIFRRRLIQIPMANILIRELAEEIDETEEKNDLNLPV